MDECKRLLLQNSGAGAVAGDALAVAGAMLARYGIHVPGVAPGPNVIWASDHLNRALNEHFCAASNHDADIERVQQVIARSLPNLLSTAIQYDDVLKEVGRTVLTTLQSRLESSRQTIGKSIVEIFRCTKDTSRFKSTVYIIFL
jgi:hypothetical protein